MTRTGFLPFIPLLALFFSTPTRAQGYYQFLGDARAVPDQVSQKYAIKYNTRGFDSPVDRNVRKMEKKGAPTSAVQEVLSFPGAPDAFSTWIDDAFEQTMQEFTQCGGELAAKASLVSPRILYIAIEPSAFFVAE